MPGVTLVDLDSLSQPVLAAESMRREAVPQAVSICTQEVEAFLDWLATMPARAAIRPLRAALEDVARREVAYHAKDAHVAERAAARIVAKLLAGPMAALRRAVQRGEPLDQHAMMLLEMFAPNGALADVPVASDAREVSAPQREATSRIGTDADLASLQPSLSPLP